MKKLILFLLLLCAFMTTGCSGSNYQTLPHLTNIQDEEGKGYVYFVRDSSFVGSMISYDITLDEQPIGVIANGTYFVKQFPVGEYLFSATTEATESITLTIQNLGSHYVECGIGIGFFAGRPTLNIMEEAEALSIIPSLDRTELAE